MSRERKNIKDYLEPGSKLYRYKTQVYYKASEYLFPSRVDVKNIKLYFIISTGRTGTRSLAKFLNHFSVNYALHEPLPNLLNEGNDYARGLIDNEKIKKKFVAARQFHFKKALANPKVQNYIESNNRLYSFIDQLRELYNEVKFIHVVRDGRDVVRSGLSRKFYTKHDTAYRIRADYFPDDPFYERWEYLDQFEKVCWWWLKKDKMIYSSTYNHPDSIMIKFNDLFDSEKKYPGLRKILDFIELEVTDEEINRYLQRVNYTKKFDFDHWSNWDNTTMKKFKAIAGQHMIRLGYKL